MTIIPFSKEGYATLLNSLASFGYEVRRFSDADSASPHLILRHDVDISLAKAAEMAALERSLGVTSTYFVLLRTEMYNALSRDNLAAIEDIRAAGHDIGLHFDCSIYADNDAALDAAARKECDILERAIEAPISVVSFHRPAGGLIGRADRVGGRLSAYSARFVKDIGYVSDSRGEWRYGQPLDHPAVSARRALQLLTHPIWWMGFQAMPVAKLDQFLAERESFLDEELARQSNVHVPGRRKKG